MKRTIGAQDAVAQRAHSPKHMCHRTGAQPARRTLLSRFHGFCREREGVQLVEFALVAPMLFVLLLGIVFLGIALNNYIVLTDSINAGSRAMALSRGQTTPALAGTDPCAYAVQVANSDATSLNTGNISYTITYTALGASSSTSYTTTCSGLVLHSQDTITVQGTYPAIIPTLTSSNGVFVWTRLGSINLVAHTSQLVQ